MLKFILIFVLIGTSGIVFSEESRTSTLNNLYQVDVETQDKSVLHIAKGVVSLFYNDPDRALWDFQKAYSYINESKDPASVEFLVLFGQVVAYDILGFRENCGRAM